LRVRIGNPSNALADRSRLNKYQVELPEDLAHETEQPAALESLAACLPRALSELSADDREAIPLSNLEGLNQENHAGLKGLTLPGAKPRMQRGNCVVSRRANPEPALVQMTWSSGASGSWGSRSGVVTLAS